MIKNPKLAILFAVIIVAVSVSFGHFYEDMDYIVYFVVSTLVMFLLSMFLTMIYIRKSKIKKWVSESVFYGIFLFALAVIVDYVVLIRLTAGPRVLTIPIFGHYLIFIPGCLLGGYIAKRLT